MTDAAQEPAAAAPAASQNDFRDDSRDDWRFMQLAPALGRRGLGRTWPNPAVGAVIGACLHLAIRVIGMRHTAVRIRPRLDLRMPALREFIGLMLPKMISHPIEPLTFLFFTAVATTLVAGSVSAVSFALGAFFAGVVLNESDLSHKAAQNSLPLQDAFAVLFFVSVGMLFDPSIVVREPMMLALGHRQAIGMRPDPAHQHGIAVEVQVLRGDRCGNVVARAFNKLHRFGGGDDRPCGLFHVGTGEGGGQTGEGAQAGAGVCPG